MAEIWTHRHDRGVGSSFEQQLNHAYVAIRGSNMQCRTGVVGNGVDISLSVEKQSNDRFMPVANSLIQWRPSIVGPGVDVGPSIEKQPNHCLVAIASSNVQSRAPVFGHLVPLDVSTVIETTSHKLELALLCGRPHSLGGPIGHGEPVRELVQQAGEQRNNTTTDCPFISSQIDSLVSSRSLARLSGVWVVGVALVAVVVVSLESCHHPTGESSC